MNIQCSFRLPTFMALFGGNRLTTRTLRNPFMRKPTRSFKASAQPSLSSASLRSKWENPGLCSHPSESMEECYDRLKDLQKTLESSLTSPLMIPFIAPENPSKKLASRPFKRKASQIDALEIHTQSGTIELAIQELTTLLTVASDEEKPKFERLRRKMVHQLLSFSFPELYGQSFQKKNPLVSSLKRSVVSSLLSAYDRFPQEDHRVPLSELIRLFSHMIPPFLREKKGSQEEKRLQHLAESLDALAFLAAHQESYVPDSFFGRSPKLDHYLLQRRYEWGLFTARKTLNACPTDPANQAPIPPVLSPQDDSLEENVAQWVKNRHALFIKTHLLEQKFLIQSKGKKKTAVFLPYQGGSIRKNKRFLEALRKQGDPKAGRSLGLLLAHLSVLETTTIRQEHLLFGCHLRTKTDIWDDFDQLGLDDQDLALLGLTEKDRATLLSFAEQGLESPAQVHAALQSLKNLSQTLLPASLSQDILAYFQDQKTEAHAPSLATPSLEEMILNMEIGDKIVLKGGTKAGATTGKIALDPGRIFGVKLKTEAERVGALDVERGSDGYKVFVRRGYELRLGVEGSAGQELLPAKIQAALGLEGGGGRLDGTTLTFPGTPDGAKNLALFFQILETQAPITARIFEKANDVASLSETIVRGQVSVSGTASVGYENDAKTIGIGANLEAKASLSGVYKGIKAHSLLETMEKGEREITARLGVDLDLTTHLYHKDNTDYDAFGVGISAVLSTTKKWKYLTTPEGYLKNAEVTRYTSLKKGAFGALSVLSNAKLHERLQTDPLLKQGVLELMAQMNNKDDVLKVSYRLDEKTAETITILNNEAQFLRRQGKKASARALEKKARRLLENDDLFIPTKISLLSVEAQRSEEMLLNAHFIKWERFAEGEHERSRLTLEIA